MRVGLVVNPVSGGGRGRRAGLSAQQALISEGLDVQRVETAAPGEAARIGAALARDGHDLVIALGGDGTVSEVADGLIAAARAEGLALPEFGFVAAGTGMDFRRNFSQPQDPAQAVRALLETPARPVDVGEASFTGPDGSSGRRHFLNVASLGISGMVAASVNRAKARGSRAGSSLYVTHAIREILRYRPQRLTIRVDGGPAIEAEIAVVAIANGGWFGGGMHLAPGADPRDGLLDLVVLKSGSRWTTLGHLATLSTGRTARSPDILRLQGRSIAVSATAPEPPDRRAVLELDGETMTGLPVTYRILPGALMLRA